MPLVKADDKDEAGPHRCNNFVMRIVLTAKNICFLFCSSKVQDSLSLRKVIDESPCMYDTDSFLRGI